jgi:hypothetical protein
MIKQVTKQIEKYLRGECPEISEEDMGNLREQGFPMNTLSRLLVGNYAFKEQDAERVASAIQEMKETTRVVSPLGAVKADSRLSLWIGAVGLVFISFVLTLMFLLREQGHKLKVTGSHNDTENLAKLKAEVAELGSKIVETDRKMNEADKRLSAVVVDMTTMVDAINNLADAVNNLAAIVGAADKSGRSRLAIKKRRKGGENNDEIPPAPPANETTRPSATTDNGTIRVIVRPVPVEDGE